MTDAMIETGAAILLSPKKIAIFGTTPSRMEGPWQDGSDWERWTIGPGGKDAHNWERLWEVHGTWPEEFKGYLNDLSNVKPPRVVHTFVDMKIAIQKWKNQHKKSDEQFAQEITGDWAANIVIDKQMLLDTFGQTWFSSSISYLAAQALIEMATDIGLFGIDLESSEEYRAQFLGCRHFMDLARFVGRNVHLPKGSALLREPTPYPDRYETVLALCMERKSKFSQQMLAKLEPEFDGCRAATFRQEGVLLTLRECGSIELIPQAEQRLVELNHQMNQMAANINHLKGANDMTEYYRRTFVYNHQDPEVMG